MTLEEIARAFSGHHFGAVHEQLSPDVRWVTHGGPTLVGRDAVIAACEETTASLAATSTTFRRFLVVVGTDAVVVDSLADYVDADGTSSVASCDVYEATDGLVTAITSYTVAV